MQQMAQGLASLGRGQDSMLVHMTPGEVHGLQQLAVSQGGSLTINPKTGLPEAGMLSSMLPMIAAAAAIALAPETGGLSLEALGAGGIGALAGGATGALQASMSGKNVLMGGLMGGLSGYGMGGVMGNLAAVPVPATGLATVAAPTVPVDVLSAANSVAPAGTVGADQFLSKVGSPPAYQSLLGTPAETLNFATAPATASFNAPSLGNYGVDSIARSMPPIQSFNDKMLSGLSATAKDPMPFLKANVGKIASAALPVGLAGIQAMSAQPTLPMSMAKPTVPNQFYNTQYAAGQRNPKFGQPGEPYFINQGYVPSGFSTAYAADGGSIQDIQANAQPVMPPNQMIGGTTPNENQFYPGANIARSGASYAPQAPSATEVVGGYDQSINQYTGEPVRMAGGGITYNQGDQTYSGEVQPYGSNYGSANLSNLFASTGFPKPLNFVLDEIGREMLPQIRQQAAPQYDYNPDNQQYIQRMAEGGTTDLGNIPLGGAMPSGFLSGIQSLMQKNPNLVKQLSGNTQDTASDYIFDPETNQYIKKSDISQPVQGMATGGDIYSDDPGPGPNNDKGMPSSGQMNTEIYKSSDPFAAVDAYVKGQDADVLDRLSKGAKNSAVGFAAAKELRRRSNAAKSYIDMPTQQAAQGGLMGLNTYAAGGKLLQGPGDGMSDSIPAVIGGAKPQRAALAQGEFVIPADVVSHLGNGSTDAGAKRLYGMMDKIRKARTGTKKQGRQINPDQFMPA
jgi:hypothetical protein